MENGWKVEWSKLERLCGPFLLSRCQLSYQIQVGPGEFMCGKREADGASTPRASPPKLQGNFVKSVLFPENLNSGWIPHEAEISNLPFLHSEVLCP